jgi:hypothetical protein
MSEIVGAEFTVSKKVSLALSDPSLTVTVIVAVPLWPLAGVTVTVRLDPLPPKTMFAFGTKVVLLLLPLTLNEPAAVWVSPTVKAIASVLFPSVIA